MRLEVPLGVLGAALVGLAVLFAATGIPAWLPRAPLVRLGVPSPLTGMTRSFVAIASGDLWGAFAWHPLGPVVFAACVATPVVAVASWIRARRSARLATAMRSRMLWWSVGLIASAVWVRQIAVLG